MPFQRNQGREGKRGESLQIFHIKNASRSLLRLTRSREMEEYVRNSREEKNTTYYNDFLKRSGGRKRIGKGRPSTSMEASKGEGCWREEVPGKKGISVSTIGRV